MGLVKDGIYKRIESSIQEVLSVCSIINADLKLGIPSNREDIIDALKNEKVISNEIMDCSILWKNFIKKIFVLTYC